MAEDEAREHVKAGMLAQADQLERDHRELLGSIPAPVPIEIMPGNQVAMVAYTAVDDCHGQDGFDWAQATTVLRDWYGCDLDPELHIKVKVCAGERDRLIGEEVRDSIKRASRR